MGMSEELFDVVNEYDEVVGEAPRPEVHRRRLRHRAVHVLVFNSRRQLFMQRRSLTKDCHPGAWDSSASGHLMVGEEYDEAAVRELEEELSWSTDELLQRLFKLEASEATGQEFVWVYRCGAEGPFRLHPEEIAEGRWFDVGEVDRWLADQPEAFAPSFPLIWQELLRQGLLGR
jgi:isopentenyl-diphosphate delta-isomerase type 1